MSVIVRHFRHWRTRTCPELTSTVWCWRILDEIFSLDPAKIQKINDISRMFLATWDTRFLLTSSTCRESPASAWCSCSCQIFCQPRPPSSGTVHRTSPVCRGTPWGKGIARRTEQYRDDPTSRLSGTEADF